MRRYSPSYCETVPNSGDPTLRRKAVVDFKQCASQFPLQETLPPVGSDAALRSAGEKELISKTIRADAANQLPNRLAD